MSFDAHSERSVTFGVPQETERRVQAGGMMPTSALEAPSAQETGESYYRHARLELLPFIPTQPRRVLEIGCGAGGFLRHFRDAERWGVEPNAIPALEARGVAFKVLNGTYENVQDQLPERYFDL